MNFAPLSEKEESIAKRIVDAAYTVHKKIGPGLLEKVYEVCFCHELSKRKLSYKRQIDIPIVYDGVNFDEGLRIDVLVEEIIICELKAVETINPVWEAQILSYLKLTNNRLGFLIRLRRRPRVYPWMNAQRRVLRRMSLNRQALAGRITPSVLIPRGNQQGVYIGTTGLPMGFPLISMFP